ncbi:hypothetical protein VB774_10895 [Pseudanabaena galeata UHCC 0370]|uniref:Uncharacterized protein n=1 Tax=Pseudanabaena galeata UHCC 0370 TaxID=3110310 RepID=A0ABU5TIM4_9CYAN|nr:hypothetical protein [Pseudanabaena galeata]MEA5478126.1 hypothetical protein [Pseudanabaena galeata UHCC 0370]
MHIVSLIAFSASDFSNSHYKNQFFESPPTAGFQKTDFGVSSAFGAGNTKIGFKMRIADQIYSPVNQFKILKN